jgi:hypothetical protein
MAYITRTTGTATDKKKFTYSAWLKLANIEVYQRPIQNYVDGNNRGYILYHHNTDANPNTWFFYDRISSQINFQATSVAKYRDTNGFYHLVVRADTTQSTQADRYRVYINNEQIDLNISVNIGQNVDLGFNSSSANLRIGGTESGSEPWKGIMSHVHFCDGQSYAPTEFGEYDANGVWKIKTSPSVTYGNNGYWVFKDDASVTDRSGNGNNFTLSGSITKTEDCPSNVFATLNALSTGIDQTLSNGNTTMVSGSETTRTPSQTTLGMSSGKYYAEFKVTTSANTVMGVVSTQDNSSTSRGTNYYTGHSALGWGYLGTSGIVVNSGSSVGGTWSTFAVGDIIGVAINLDDTQGGLNKLYFSKNGVWQNGADPSNFTSVTGVVGITAPSNTDEGFYYFSVGDGSGGTSSGAECNFGNGYFGTTAVSSAGTNASGIGIFEYDVPSGYTALSTKGLNL